MIRRKETNAVLINTIYDESAAVANADKKEPKCYRLESTDPATGLRERLSLSAVDTAQAIEQMERMRQRHEMAGESRPLVLYYPAHPTPLPSSSSRLAISSCRFGNRCA